MSCASTKSSEILFPIIANPVVYVGRKGSKEAIGHIASAGGRVSRIDHLGGIGAVRTKAEGWFHLAATAWTKNLKCPSQKLLDQMNRL